jgi:catechol 2,3-dioxygenase-like lactoylglutathione lyase family enzyme
MQIRHVIIKVDDQDRTLSFYTSIGGFVRRLDFPMGRVRLADRTLAGGSCGR